MVKIFMQKIKQSIVNLLAKVKVQKYIPPELLARLNAEVKLSKNQPYGVVGVYLGSSVTRMIEVDKNESTLRVLNWGVEYIKKDENLENAHSKALSEFIKNKKVSAKNVAVVVSGEDIIYKLVELPILPENEVLPAIKFQLESILPAQLEETVINYQRIEGMQIKGQQVYFVVQMPKSYINRALKVAGASGLVPIKIIPPSAALKDVSNVSGREPHVLVYIGKYASIIVLVKEGQVLFAREISLGGDTISNAMVGTVQTNKGKIQLDYEKADKLRLSYGVPLDIESYSKETGLSGSEVLAMMRPALEKIGAELLRTFDYFREETGDRTEFKAIYLTGGVAKTKNLIEYFENMLGLKVKELPQLPYSGNEKYEDESPLYSMAFGAAANEKAQLNFLPDEYRNPLSAFMRKWGSWRNILAVSIITLLLVFWVFSAQQNRTQRELMTLRNRLHLMNANGLNLSANGKDMATLMTELGMRGGIDRFVQIINLLDKNTPKNIYFNNVNYDNRPNQLLLNGVVVGQSRETAGLADFMKSLNASGYFSSIELLNMEKSSRNSSNFDFSLKCILLEMKR